ncbi:hypothetical protein [Rheinheimera sp. NSM]|uniref:hypothetical protein n=1 Tax=Rheinheimera sp. NSM TaxID=3457884 RepID=UPI004036F86D
MALAFGLIWYHRMCFRIIFIVFFSLPLICSCAAQQVGFTKSIIADQSLAIKKIEQVFYEQSIKHRPESIVITNDYLGLSSGTQVETKGAGFTSGVAGTLLVGIGTSKSYVKDITDRIYFNSIGKIALFKKRDWFIIQINHSDGRLFRNIYTRDKSKATEFIGSIYYFLERS